MKNIFGTSEFANAGAILAQAMLAGQPNATESAAWQNAKGAQTLAQGMAKQEAIKKAKKEEKKAKKKKAFGSVGSILGTIGAAAIPGVGPLMAPLVAGAGGTIGGMVGERLAGGPGGSSFGDAAMQYGAPAAISAGAGVGKELMNRSVNNNAPMMMQGQTIDGNFVTKPKQYKLGKALNSMYDRYELNPEPDGSFTYYNAGAYRK